MTSYYFIKNLPECSEEELKIFLNENNAVFTKVEIMKNEDCSMMAKVFFSTTDNSNPNLDFVEAACASQNPVEGCE